MTIRWPFRKRKREIFIKHHVQTTREFAEFYVANYSKPGGRA